MLWTCSSKSRCAETTDNIGSDQTAYLDLFHRHSERAADLKIFELSAMKPTGFSDFSKFTNTTAYKISSLLSFPLSEWFQSNKVDLAKLQLSRCSKLTPDPRRISTWARFYTRIRIKYAFVSLCISFFPPKRCTFQHHWAMQN